jgi:hypothetical protein
MRTPQRLPSPKEFALLGWDARLEVIAKLQSLRLAYLKTESADLSSARYLAIDNNCPELDTTSRQKID